MEGVTRSPSECGAVVQAFMECLRYTLTMSHDHSCDQKLADFLVQDQVGSEKI